MNITVRDFEEGDRPALRRLYLESRNASFVWNAAGLHQLADFDAHTEGERIFVATGDSLPPGSACLGFASIWVPDSFLHNLFVHPSAFRRGIGRALLRHCEQHLVGPPTLKCLKANVNAIRFYASLGWSAVSEHAVPDGPYFLMVKAATQPRAGAC